MTGQHQRTGEQRLARLRARLKSRGLRRGLLIAGFATVAWLAGSATANADSGPVTDTGNPTPVLANALESAAAPEESGAQRSTRPTGTRPAVSTVDTAASETPNRVLRFTQPVTAPLAKQAAPTVMTPLETAARPVAELDAVTKPVDGTLKRIARPVAAGANPIGAMLPWAQPGSDETETETVRDQRVPAAAEARHGHPAANATLNPAEPHHRYADGRSNGSEPSHNPAKPASNGIAAMGGLGTGTGPGGSPTHDNGAGLAMSAADTAVNAGTSRVNPATAATGLLPDHVEDPAVSPD